MRLRFLAAAGQKRDRTALDRKLRCVRGRPLVRRFDSELLSVWTEAETPLLEDERGTAVAVGLMFDRPSAQRMRRLPASANLGETVLRNCWGAFVLLASGGPSHWVLRDPSGSIPVYHGAVDGLSLYASDWEMLRLGWAGTPRPNLDAVRHWLALPFLRTSLTGVLGVTELLPGAVHEMGPRGPSGRQLWSPAEFASATFEIGFEEAAGLLRDEILRTAPLLAAGEKVTLRLSGGLDSSIVAAALAHVGIDFRAVTFATRTPEGDERRYARQVADRFGIELDELLEPDLEFRLETATGPLRRPPNPLLQPLQRAFAAAAGTALMVDGAGGDNVFASLNTASPAIDAFRKAGLPGATSTLRDIAGLHGCTFWEAARAALRRTLRAGGARWPTDLTFLSAAGSEDPSQAHPWLASTAGVPPGSADHIRMIAGVHHFLPDPASGEPCTIHPLLAQPVVELCLRIPSWLWIAGGRDRAVARAAFRGLVPDAVLDRCGKGSLQAMFIKGYMAKRAELREFLVSGRLAQEGIVDTSAIVGYLDRREPPRDALYIRILEIFSAEQWLRSFAA